jgi:hypothetical protein
LDSKKSSTRSCAIGYSARRSDALTPEAETIPWYEDPAQLRQKSEELGVSHAQLAKLIGRHPSYIEEIESGCIALKVGRES